MAKNQRLDIQQLPPGFRFHPSDEELIVHYLRKKATKSPMPASIVADVELYKYNPWDLPKKATTYGDEEWYFFTPRERKYPNGTRPNRMAGSGYWKAVGIDKPILSYCGSKVLGVKKALVFYIGRPPKGSKTDWIMQEYRVPELEVPWSNNRDKSLTLDDWVLCRVSHKTSMAGSMCEERNIGPTPSRQPLQFLPKMDKEYVYVEDEAAKKQSHPIKSSSVVHETILPVASANNPEMITDYFRKEGPMFPLVLLVNPSQENNYRNSVDSVNSCLSYETNNNNNNNKSTDQSSVSEENINNHDYYRVANMGKRKLPFESGNDDEGMVFKNPNKKVVSMNNNNVNPNIVSGMASSYSSSITTTTQMEKNNNFNGEQMGPTMYHDLYRLAFS